MTEVLHNIALAVALALGGGSILGGVLLILAGLTLAGLLVWRLLRGHREEVAYEAEMADYVDDQQAAVGRVAVPQPQWHVWYTPITLSDADRAEHKRRADL